MMKFLKSGTTYIPAANVTKMAPNSTTATSLDINYTGDGTTALVVSSLAGNVELLIEEINYGKQVIIDLAAIAAL